MIDKIGIIRNPLTVIAMFAGIAEVSGTVVLPFVDKSNQFLFICFLISFPLMLVLSFFLTLNFNNKVLYAPSDYKDERNYITINKYDMSRQRKVEVEVMRNFREDNLLIDIGEKEKMEVYEFYVSNFKNARGFIAHMEKSEIHFKVYTAPGADESKQVELEACKAIWIGIGVPLEVAQKVIAEAREYYPHLQYVDLFYDVDASMGDNVFYVGGTTEAAEGFDLRVLEEEDFEELGRCGDLGAFHRCIEGFRSGLF